MKCRGLAGPADIVLLAVSAILILRPLARFWSENTSYAYGWGVPCLAAYLFYERWRCRPAPVAATADPALLAFIAGAWALAFLALRLVAETEPASRPLLWMSGCLLAAAILAWIGLLGGREWTRHFAFPVLFLMAAVPWIFQVEWLLVQELARGNAAAVAGTLTALGVPIRAAGNTLVLATGQLVVNEGCSGIRSLQASLMLALFFGEFYRFRVAGRLALVAVGAGLALLGNFTRLAFLAWRGATQGVAAVEPAHASAGSLILIFTLAGLWLACLLTRPPKSRPRATVQAPPEAARRRSLAWAGAIFVATIGAEVVTQGWYAWRGQSAPRYPSWTVAWPREARDFRMIVPPVSTREELRAADMSGARWRDAAGLIWNGLWIRYRTGAAGKVVFESHNPALCLPAAGWHPAGTGASFALEDKGIKLEAEATTFSKAGTTMRVFWIPYLNGGVRAGADEEPSLYGHALAATFAGRFPWLADVWAGCRSANAETLEVAVTGAATDSQAQTAFRKIAEDLIRPEPVDSAPLVARTH